MEPIDLDEAKEPFLARLSPMKNPTPQQIAIFCATIPLVVITFILGIIYRLYGQMHWWHLIIVPVMAGAISYVCFYYALEVFIYRRIKVIYKTIYKLKAPKEIKNTGIDMRSEIIGDVSQQVLDWANTNMAEIEELKKNEEFRREFLGNVSHELKTPIFSIQGYISTLLDNPDEDKDIQMLYLDKASRNVDRLCTIVEDLESISKLEAGVLTLEPRVFDIKALTIDIFELMELQAKEKNIQMTFKEGNERAYLVEGDKDRIKQVLVNLVSNSIKYGKMNGVTTVGFYDMHEQVLIEVSDDGIGIEEKNLGRVFERFYRVDKSRSRAAGGTGLGLAIVKHIIEAHRQTINVRSTYGNGSTFGFTLKKSR